MPAAETKLDATSGGDGESPLRRDKRNHILEAAIRIFARMGYHGARISDIAREAGIAYGLVYHYFKNKEEILHTIFEDRWGAFLETVEAVAEGPGPTRDKLLSIAALVLNAYRLRPEWVKVLVLEIQRSSRFAEPSQLRAVGELFRRVEGLLRAGQRAGELRADVDPEVAAYLFLGGLELVITASVLEVLEIAPGGAQEYFQKVARTVVDVFLRGVAAGGGAA